MEKKPPVSPPTTFRSKKRKRRPSSTTTTSRTTSHPALDSAGDGRFGPAYLKKLRSLQLPECLPLLPFLTSNDLLRLSETSKLQLPFRKQMQTLCITSHPYRFANHGALFHSLACIVFEAEGLQCLRVADRQMVPFVLDQVRKGACPRFKEVILSGCALTDDDAVYVAAMLESPVGQHLEVLDVSRSPNYRHHLTKEGEGKILQALSKGCCPLLKHLRLSGFCSSHRGNDTKNSLGTALQSTTPPNRLIEVDLSLSFLDSQQLSSVAEALQSGCCPDLQDLKLGIYKCTEGIEILASAFSSGSLRRLTSLGFYGRHGGPHLELHWLNPIFHALHRHHLRTLRLHNTLLTAHGAPHLSAFLSSSNLLDCLDFTGMREVEQRDTLFTGIFESIHHLHLHHMDLSRCGLTASHCHALSQQLLGAGGSLEVLVLADNPHIGDSGMTTILQAFRHGTPPNHRLTHLDLSTAGMGTKAAAALAAVMKDGQLRSLQDLRLSDNRLQEGGGVVVLQALSVINAVPRLKVLHLWRVGLTEAGAHLIETGIKAKDGAWPALEELELSFNPLGDRGCIALANALRVAGGQCCLRVLNLWEVGMEEEGLSVFLKAFINPLVGRRLREIRMVHTAKASLKDKETLLRVLGSRKMAGTLKVW